jgi:hypothetical protein
MDSLGSQDSGQGMKFTTLVTGNKLNQTSPQNKPLLSCFGASRLHVCGSSAFASLSRDFSTC